MRLLLRTVIGLLCATGILTGCATSSPNVELSIARQAVDTACNEGALSYAPEQFNRATATLQHGEQLLAAGQTQEGISALEQATQMAITARSSARIQREAIIRYQQELDNLAPQQRINELKTKLSDHSDSATTLAPIPEQPAVQLPAPTPPAPNPPPQPVAEYRVVYGENLYAIAARPAIYGEGLLWPLIYRANRDQIKDPQQIFPGQILSIPRNHTSEERESAREMARQLGIFLP